MEARAPRVNGRHASMDATRQWTSRVNGRLASMDASPVQAAHAYRAWLSSKKLISRGGGSE